MPRGRISRFFRRIRRADPVPQHQLGAGPIQRLPPDILELIFLALVGSDAHRLTGSDRMQRTLRIGHVCHRWRVVLYDYPAMWSTIDIASAKPHTLSILQHFIKNSASHPLRIIACLQISGPTSSSIRRDCILDELLAHLSRWETVFLTINWVVYEPLYQIAPGSLEQLTSITFSAPGWRKEHVQAFWTNVCHKKNRNLRYVSWQVDFLNHPPTFAPWDRLAHVKFGSFASLSEVMKILPLCGSLEVLSIKELRKNPTGAVLPPIDGKITLEKLQALEIRPSDGTDISPLFDRLSVPRLVKLDATFTPPPYIAYQHYAFPFNSLFEMLVRSQCHLQTLRIGTLWVVVHESQVLRYLKNPFAQTVTDLTLAFWTTDAIVEALASLPRLTHLVCKRACPTDGVLARALRSLLGGTNLGFVGESASNCLHIEMPLDPLKHLDDCAVIAEAQGLGLLLFSDTRPKPVNIQTLGKKAGTKLLLGTL
ncbi:hypothetical protein BDN72DRAFT_443608 [Pluteus cervinus]|uniref:Uncharacterized protein n=1 Tax=Pluteus cervinus TaxID=181527 RepID=A0ACD3BCI2_9AGAR|nr:hypothetical protein BDN72DRAFT_443608 [Pluteus cervinus]